VRAEDLPHALSVQAVSPGDLFERQALHSTQPEHLVLAGARSVGVDRLDPDVQAESLHDQQRSLQRDRSLATLEIGEHGRLHASQARYALPAEPQLAAPLLQDAAKFGRRTDG